MKESLPHLAITMGDPAGVGAEVVLKALQHESVYEQCVPLVFGDVLYLQKVAKEMRLPLRVMPAAEGVPDTDVVCVVQSTRADLSGVRFGELSAEAGRAGGDSVVVAAQAVMSGEFSAVVTAPLNKEAMAMGGYAYPGHTELLADITRTEKYGMLLLSGNLRVIHVSTHVSLREAIERVKTARILECIRLGATACRSLGIAQPHIAVAGLNPHAGEHGLFGTEDAEEIAPAVSAALAEGIHAEGPLPPDTVFAKTANGDYELVVAMYHDQGHIPVKLHGFDTGVNVTLGLPIIRVSVDHGTAFDIAGKGIAREQSMLEAIRVATLMVRAKQQDFKEKQR